MRRWAHRTHLAGLFLAAAALACQPTDRATPPPPPPPPPPPTSPGGVAVTDDAGRRVTLSAPARRIVSLSPAVTELLFALGAGDWVVGRTTWCDYPPAERAVPSVGDGLNPNLEAVAARRPDLVILYRSALNETAAQQLARLGIAAAVVRQDRLEDLARAAGLVATLTGRGAAGASLARGIDSLLHAPAPPAPAAARRRVAFVVWDNPPMVIGGGSYLDELATLAGTENVFHDIPAPRRRYHSRPSPRVIPTSSPCSPIPGRPRCRRGLRAGNGKWSGLCASAASRCWGARCSPVRLPGRRRRWPRCAAPWRRPDEVARAGCGRRGGIRAGRRCGARACAARQSHDLGHRALPAAAACDPRVRSEEHTS